MAKHPGGAPTKYNEEIQKKADKYVEIYHTLDQVIPSTAGLALYLGVAKQSLYNWAEEYKQFMDTLARIQAKQEVLAVNKGLSSEFQPTITKLVLANHGYHEKQEIEQTITEYKVNPPPKPEKAYED